MKRRKMTRITLSILAVFMLIIPAGPNAAMAKSGGSGSSAKAAAAEPYIKMADYLLSLQTKDGALRDAAGWNHCNGNSSMMYALMGLGAAYRKSGDKRYLEGLEKGIRWLAKRENMGSSKWRGSFYYAYDVNGKSLAAKPDKFTVNVRGTSSASALFVYLVYLARQLNPASKLPSELESSARAALSFVLKNNKNSAGLFYNGWRQDKNGKWNLYKTCYAADQADVWLGLIAGARLYGSPAWEKAAGGLKKTTEKNFYIPEKKRYAVSIDEKGRMNTHMGSIAEIFPQGYLPLVWGNTKKNRAALNWLKSRASKSGKTTCYKGDKGAALTAALLYGGRNSIDKNLDTVKNWLIKTCYDAKTGGVRSDSGKKSSKLSNAAAFSIMALTGWRPRITGISAPAGKPLIAVHSTVWSNADANALISDIGNLAKKSVNLLFVEVGYNYQYKKMPKLAAAAGLSFAMARKISKECKKYNIRVVPEINCLGHQSWGKKTDTLLSVYPQFDETPSLYPNNEGIYCRSWCPLHPDLNNIVFSLMDELIEAFQADAFHVGLDEVMLIGEDACKRCKGKDKGELFARAVNDYYNHLVKKKGVTMFMWGDRLLDGKGLKDVYNEYASSYNGTFTAIDKIPRDIVICDWHYGKLAVYPSIQYLLGRGFQVLTASYSKVSAAKSFVDATVKTRKNNVNMLGHIYTNWLQAGAVKHSAWPPFVQTVDRIIGH